MSPQELAAAADRNATAALALLKAIKEEFKPFHWLVWIGGVIIVLQFATSIVGTVGTWMIIDGRESSRATQRATLQTATDLRNCLDPAGECYKESRENQAAAVLQIIKAGGDLQKEVARCTYKPLEEFDACVDVAFDKMYAAAGVPTPTPTP